MMKNGSTEHLGRPVWSELHLRGKECPSSPGFTAMLGTMDLQLRHWMVIRVALARTPDAWITMPGTFTSRAMFSDWGREWERRGWEGKGRGSSVTLTRRSLSCKGLASECNRTCMSCSSSPSGRGLVTSSAASRAASSNYNARNTSMMTHTHTSMRGTHSGFVLTSGRYSAGSRVSLSASWASKLARSSMDTDSLYWQRL